MKKLVVLALFTAVALGLRAQVEVTTKSFELASQDKHRGWTILEGGVNATTNEVFIKFAQPICDSEKSKSFWTPSITYRGLKWNIDKLIFNSSFDFLKTDSKNYGSTEEALAKNEMVFGKTFMPNNFKAFDPVTMPNRVNNSYMFTSVVVPVVELTGFKIKSGRITCGPLGTTCTEIPYVFETSEKKAKAEKGQQWIPVFNNPIPNGGNILFGTAGVNPDPTKTHYVFRKYDEMANEIRDQEFSFDYQCQVTTREIEIAPGRFDYIMIVAPINYKKSKGKLVPANQYEYIRVDGETFATKERIPFTAAFTSWGIQTVLEKDGAVYLLGPAGESNTEYTPLYDLNPFEHQINFQVLKISNGKVDFIKGYSKKDNASSLQLVKGVKGTTNIGFYLQNPKIKVQSGKVFYSGQIIEKLPNSFGALVTMVIGENGTLETYLAKPQKGISFANTYFSKDNKTMYWIIEDVLEYNKLYDDYRGLTADKYKFLANGLGVVKYSVENKVAENFQSFMNEEWALGNNSFLFDADDQIVLQGRKLTKKAKEGEIVFVSIKK